MQILKKHLKKLIIAAVLTLAVAASSSESSASDLSFTFVADNGSFGILSCGSSCGNYRAVYDATNGSWTYWDAYPGDCP